MTGYEKSPDYGVPVTRWTYVWTAVIVVVVLAVAAWLVAG